MQKIAINRARLDLRLTPETPLLIRAGDKGRVLLHPELPDMMFVRTGAIGNETVYIPGASLKGVIRSAAERVLRTVGVRCCDPMEHKTVCHDDASKAADRPEKDVAHPQARVHAMVCYACRTFGSQAISSRVRFSDARPGEGQEKRANATEVRNGVAIDRKTGGPARGKLYDLEVVTGGEFVTRIHLENVQLWQLALLGFVLQDMNDGFVRLGGGKSRGFGAVQVGLEKLVFEQAPGRAERPAGVAALRGDLVGPYGLCAAGADRIEGELPTARDAGAFFDRWTFEGDAAWRFLEGCQAGPWAAFRESAERADGEGASRAR